MDDQQRTRLTIARFAKTLSCPFTDQAKNQVLFTNQSFLLANPDNSFIQLATEPEATTVTTLRSPRWYPRSCVTWVVHSRDLAGLEINPRYHFQSTPVGNAY